MLMAPVVLLLLPVATVSALHIKSVCSSARTTAASETRTGEKTRRRGQDQLQGSAVASHNEVGVAQCATAAEEQSV